MPNPIPRMTQFIGTWQQPKLDHLNFDAMPGHVSMPIADFKLLARYDTTLPSGVYAGKMWKRDIYGVDHLVWFEDHPDIVDQCVIKWLPIVMKEMLDLLTSGQDISKPANR